MIGERERRLQLLNRKLNWCFLRLNEQQKIPEALVDFLLLLLNFHRLMNLTLSFGKWQNPCTTRRKIVLSSSPCTRSHELSHLCRGTTFTKSICLFDPTTCTHIHRGMCHQSLGDRILSTLPTTHHWQTFWLAL